MATQSVDTLTHSSPSQIGSTQRSSQIMMTERAAPSSSVQEEADYDVGDNVKVDMEVELLQDMQKNCGGWHREMAKVIGEVGIAQRITQRYVEISYPSGMTWRFNPAAVQLAEKNVMATQSVDTLTHSSPPQIGSTQRSSQIMRTERATSSTSSSSVQEEADYDVGDNVKVDLEVELLKDMQKNYGGWHREMAMVIGEVGIAQRITQKYVAISYPSGMTWRFNPAAVQLVEKYVMPPKPGDPVRIESDEEKFRKLQVDHGDWVNPMRDVLGEIGFVKDKFRSGDLRVRVGSITWTMNASLTTKLGDRELDMLKKKYKDDTTYRPGDIIQVIRDEKLVRSLQVDHGEWVDQMKVILGLYGFVKKVYDDKDLRIKVKENSWTVNPRTVVKVVPAKSISIDFNVGNQVRIEADEQRLKELQCGHGEWVDPMGATLGRVGTIERFFSSGDVRVKVMGRAWTFNVDALSRIPDNCTDDDTDGFHAGDKVRIHESEAFIKEQQRDHGGWVYQMNAIPGKVGKVEAVLPNCDVRVKVLGRTWTMNCVALKKLPNDTVDDSEGFRVGETVRILADEDRIKKLQDNHGEWVDLMRLCLGRHGTVNHVYQSGDIKVIVRGMTWTFNPAAVERADSSDDNYENEIGIGDKVQVTNDPDEMKAKQEGHGGYIEIMTMILDKVGVVKRIFTTGDIKVQIMGTSWTLNPAIVVKVSPDVNENENTVQGDIAILMGEMSKLARSSAPGSLFAAASQGDIRQVRRLLKEGKYVDEAFGGQTPLHIASHSGRTDVMRLLLKYKASLLSEDEDGDTPLHIAVYGDEPEACKLLIEAKTDPSVRNRKAQTPLNIAANKGFLRIVKLLLELKANVNAQDNYGDTVLHDAISGSHDAIVQVLLDAGADTNISNNKGFIPLHFAATKGYTEGLRFLLEHYKKKNIAHRVDEQKDDGFTALHLAAINNNVEAVQLLITVGEANINSQNGLLQTAMHLAVNNDRIECVKALVQAGCDVNIGDKDGDTPLHESMRRVTLKFMQAKATGASGDTGASGLEDLQTMLLGALTDLPSIAISVEADDIAVFLAQNGADVTRKNNRGETPTDLCVNIDVRGRIIAAAHDYVRKRHMWSRAQQINALPSGPDKAALRGIHEKVQRHAEVEQFNNDPHYTDLDLDKEDPSNPWWSERKCLLGEICRLKDRNICPVCMDDTRDMVFNCGHATCRPCSDQMDECPVCRNMILSRIKYYF